MLSSMSITPCDVVIGYLESAAITLPPSIGAKVVTGFLPAASVRLNGLHLFVSAPAGNAGNVDAGYIFAALHTPVKHREKLLFYSHYIANNLFSQ